MDNSAVGAIANNYLRKGTSRNEGLEDIKEFGFNDAHNFGILPGSEGDYSSHKIIDDCADRVNANYESCHVGETIIPALKE